MHVPAMVEPREISTINELVIIPINRPLETLADYNKCVDKPAAILGLEI